MSDMKDYMISKNKAKEYEKKKAMADFIYTKGKEKYEASEAFNAGSAGAAPFVGASADCSSSSLRTSASNSSIVFSISLAIG